MFIMLARAPAARMPLAASVMLVAALLVAALGLPAHAQMREIRVLSAVSLADALDDANLQYQQLTGRKVFASYAASGTLAKQIENGAPADIFISADIDWMDYLAKLNLIRPETRFNLLGNKLVLVKRAGSTMNLTIGPNFPLAQALGNGRLAIADHTSVPAGKYGKAALESLGVWASVADKLAPPGEDVRASLAFVSRGEAPLGIVYQTDTIADKGVEIVGTFPASSHPPIIYPLAVSAASANPDTASYIEFLRSSAVKPAFGLQGFVLLR